MDPLLPLTITAILLFILSFISDKINFFSIPLFIVGGVLAQPIISEHTKIIFIFAQLGLLLLLFYIGFEVSPIRYLKNIRKIIVDGNIDLSISLLIPLLIFLLFTRDLRLSILLAALLYISSSAINLKIIIDSRFAIYGFAERAINILLYQDVIISILITLLPILFIEFKSEVILITASNIFILLISLVIIYYLLKLLQRFIDRFTDESIILLSFSILLISSLMSSRLINSEVLGAFMAGSIIRATGFRIDMKRSFAALKDVFSPFFFFYFGLNIHLHFSADIKTLLIIAIPLSVLTKYLLSYLFYPANSGRSIFRNILFGLLTIRGEFSIVLASISLKYLGEQGQAIIMIVSTSVIIFNMIIGLLLISISKGKLTKTTP